MTKNAVRRTGRFRNKPRQKRGFVKRKPTRAKFALQKTGRPTRSWVRTTKMMATMQEKKRLSIQTSTTLDNAGQIYTLSYPIKGTGQNQRIGEKIFARYWNQRIVLKNIAGTGASMVRIAVVGWRNDRTQPAIGDFPTNSMAQQFDLDKFIVVSDQSYSIGGFASSTTINSGAPSTIFWKRSLKLFKNLNFDSANANPNENVYYIFLWSDNLVATAQKISLETDANFTYTDS